MEKIIEELRENAQRIVNMITWKLKYGDELFGPEVKGNEYIMRSLEFIRDSYDVEDNIALGFIDLDEKNNSLVINEDKLQRTAKEIIEKRIEGWRAKGEKNIEKIVNCLNTNYKNYTKEAKNEFIIRFLESPISYYNAMQSYSMGFIELDEEKGIPVINEDKLIRRAKGKNVEVLRERLLNKEMYSFVLDIILQLNGYESAISNRDDDEIEEIKEEGSVECAAKDTDEAELLISFDIAKNNGPYGIEDSFYLKVTDIKRI